MATRSCVVFGASRPGYVWLWLLGRFGLTLCRKKDMNYQGSTCICRVPKAQLRQGTIVECVHCGTCVITGPFIPAQRPLHLQDAEVAAPIHDTSYACATTRRYCDSSASIHPVSASLGLTRASSDHGTWHGWNTAPDELPQVAQMVQGFVPELPSIGPACVVSQESLIAGLLLCVFSLVYHTNCSA